MSKNFLITGAARRLGRALALGFAADGGDIAFQYHRGQAEADSLSAEITSMGQRVLPLQADLSDLDTTCTLIARARDRLGTIDVLINNAACFERDTVDGRLPTATKETDSKPERMISAKSWALHVDVNLRAPTFLMRDFAAQATPGSVIINMIDQRVWQLTPDFISYTVAKAGLWTLTQTFAQALAPSGIRVNGIGPGPTLPGPRQSTAGFERQVRAVPLATGPTPTDIVDAARYILSATTMTGQMLALDGGQHLAWQTPDVRPEEE